MPMSPEDQKAFDDLKAASDASKKENDELKAKLAAKENPPPPKKEDEDDEDDDLRNKARKEKEGEESKKAEGKKLERALGFNMSVATFVKENEDLLPSEFSDILKTAEKENYDNAIDKANVVKAAFIKAFFDVEAHREFITKNQKIQLDDYFKLTKNAKEEKADHIYENLFEPAMEMARKLKKAEQVGLSRTVKGTQAENDYMKKLINVSKKAHLGEKGAE